MPRNLVVDEALASATPSFNIAACARIREMQESGLTILLFHTIPSAIRALCSRAVLLHAGCVEAIGKPTDVLNRYRN